jgi:hypothetical protein
MMCRCSLSKLHCVCVALHACINHFVFILMRIFVGITWSE